MFYHYQNKEIVYVGDIVLIESSDEKMIGEVFFRFHSKSIHDSCHVGLHVRILYELHHKRTPMGASDKYLRDVPVERLTLLSRGQEKIRYLTGEPVRDGDIVLTDHGDVFDVSQVKLIEGTGDTVLMELGNYYLSTTPLESTNHGCVIFPYWDEDGYIDTGMQDVIFVCRAKLPYYM